MQIDNKTNECIKKYFVKDLTQQKNESDEEVYDFDEIYGREVSPVGFIDDSNIDSRYSESEDEAKATPKKSKRRNFLDSSSDEDENIIQMRNVSEADIGSNSQSASSYLLLSSTQNKNQTDESIPSTSTGHRKSQRRRRIPQLYEENFDIIANQQGKKYS